MIPATPLEGLLADRIRHSIRDLKLLPAEAPDPPIALEIPRIRSHGDLSSSVAMQLASQVKRPPLEIAQAIADHLQKDLGDSSLCSSIEKLEVKPPGFINLFLSRQFLYQVLREVLASGPRYGRSTLGEGKRALVEFVSANPTGPLSVAHGRQAAVGDALANLLAFAGYRVAREYYLNDEGTQIDLLGASILARAREAMKIPSPFPENGYKGAYVVDCGKELARRFGNRRLEGKRAPEIARKFGVQELTRLIRRELDRFGIRFNRWFPQSSLNRFQYLNRTLDRIKRRGFLYESEGAWWLKSTSFGDDKDRVVIRSDGRQTYIAADIAYHRLKFERGFDLLVNLWGPDHHGYIPRLKAAVQALGFPAEGLQIRIVQLCTLKRGTETIPMSTREGRFITLTQVMDEVGRDAARFFFLLRKSDAHLEFDLELAKRQSLENPVYYIQYAHARVCSILAFQKRKRGPGFSLAPKVVYSLHDLCKKGCHSRGSGNPILRSSRRMTALHDSYSLLAAAEELTLLRLLREFPGVVELAARSLESFPVVAYLQELADRFHRFYDTHRVVTEDVRLTAARLDLIEAVKTVLNTGLRLLGVSAPTKM